MCLRRPYAALCFVFSLCFGCSMTSNKNTGGAIDDSGYFPSNCSTTPKSDGDYPIEVGTVIQNRCQECHQNPPQHNAHFSLLRFEDTQQPYGIAGELRWQRMAQVIEPGVLPHMPFQDAGQLTPDELQTLHDWFEACALPVPEGQGYDKGE